MRQCDNLTTINLLTIVGGVSCFVVSMLDGFSCLAGSSAKCVPRDLISLPVLRIMASSVIYLHCCFMLYGRSTSPSRGVAWFFVSSACLDVALGTSTLFLGLGVSTGRDVFGQPLLLQRWIFGSAAAFSITNDTLVSTKMRHGRYSLIGLLGFLLGVILICVGYSGDMPVWTQILLIGMGTTVYSSQLALIALEIVRGPVDQWIDPFLATIEECLCQSETPSMHESSRSSANGPPLGQGEGVQGAPLHQQLGVGGKAGGEASCSRIWCVCGGSARVVNTGTHALALENNHRHCGGYHESGHGSIDPHGDDGSFAAASRRRSIDIVDHPSTPDGSVSEEGHILEGMSAPAKRRASQRSFLHGKPGALETSGSTEDQFRLRLWELRSSEWLVLVYLVCTSLISLTTFGTRFFGWSMTSAGIISALSETMLGLIRCAMAVAVLHEDITAVARKATKAQEWQRKAADARLHAIQQFTRYIFHEARVPLQAVTLAVDELEEGLKEGMEKTSLLAQIRVASDGPSSLTPAASATTPIARQLTSSSIDVTAVTEAIASKPSQLVASDTARMPVAYHAGRFQMSGIPPQMLSSAMSGSIQTSSPRRSQSQSQADRELALSLHATLVDIKEVLRSQREGCKGLQLIFDDVLEAQRIEQGRLRLRDDEVDIAQVLGDIRTIFRRQAEAKDIKLAVEMAHAAVPNTDIADQLERPNTTSHAMESGTTAIPMPSVVRGDPVRIKQVVSNLVSNALKFTPEGGTVTLGVRLAPAPAEPSPRSLQHTGAHQGSLGGESTRRQTSTRSTTTGTNASAAGKLIGKIPRRQSTAIGTETESGKISSHDNKYRIAITVRDTGVGIGAEDLEGLFVPYKQARHGVEYTGSSSGLGLYISRGIARQMGGDLRGMSGGIGLGSKFVFEFEANLHVASRASSSSSSSKSVAVPIIQQMDCTNQTIASPVSLTAKGVGHAAIPGNSSTSHIVQVQDTSGKDAGINAKRLKCDTSTIQQPVMASFPLAVALNADSHPIALAWGAPASGSSMGLSADASRSDRQLVPGMFGTRWRQDSSRDVVDLATGWRQDSSRDVVDQAKPSLESQVTRGISHGQVHRDDLPVSSAYTQATRNQPFRSTPTPAKATGHQADSHGLHSPTASRDPDLLPDSFISDTLSPGSSDPETMTVVGGERATATAMRISRRQVAKTKKLRSDTQGTGSKSIVQVPALGDSSCQEQIGDTPCSIDSDLDLGSDLRGVRQGDMHHHAMHMSGMPGFHGVEGVSLSSSSLAQPLQAPVSPLQAWCLVVDDVAPNRVLLARGLKRLGYATHLASDGKEALEACRRRVAEVKGAGEEGVKEQLFSHSLCLGLVTMDKSMPVMDGIEATRAIRAEFGGSFVIVGLTGDALGEDLESFRGAGLDGVMGKPASAKEIHMEAERLIGVYEQRVERAESDMQDS